MSSEGDVNVQIVTAPLDAASIKTAMDNCITAIPVLSGSYITASFNDSRGLAIIGITYQ